MALIHRTRKTAPQLNSQHSPLVRGNLEHTGQTLPHVASIVGKFDVMADCLKHILRSSSMSSIQYLQCKNDPLQEKWPKRGVKMEERGENEGTTHSPGPLTSSCLHTILLTQRGAFLQAVRAPKVSSS